MKIATTATNAKMRCLGDMILGRWGSARYTTIIAPFACKGKGDSHPLINDDPRDVARAIRVEDAKVFNQFLKTLIKALILFEPHVATLKKGGICGSAKH